MRSVNQAIILGNVTRDPELKYTPNGNPVITFGIATNRYWRNQAGEKQEAVEFHNIVFWGKLAELLSQYVKKGNKIFVQGRLQTREWEGKDGVKRRNTEIVGRDFILLSPKSQAEAQPEDPKFRPPGEKIETKEPEPEKPEEVKSGEEIKPEDIPF